jgi:hypothetical protein
MTIDYQKVWKTMNELEMVTSKICSAREILDSAMSALENHKLAKTETLMYAVDEYLQYYLQEFDIKFKDAWKETVIKISQSETKLSCDKDDTSLECKGAWNSFWEENYYPEEVKDDCMPPWGHSDMEALSQQKEDKVVKWRLPVEEVKDSDTDETEYFVTFPDDLLQAANLNPGDEVEWVDQNDGSFILRKVTKPLGMDEC